MSRTRIMNVKKLLGKRIKEIRRSKKYTQEQLAELVGIETGSLSAIESGRHYPSLPTLVKISEILNVEPKSLFDFKEHLSCQEKQKFILENIKNISEEKINFIYRLVETAKV